MSAGRMDKMLARVTVKAPAKDDPIIIDEKALLTFIAWGDPQISSLSPLRSARLLSACRDLENMQGRADALVMLGDITEYGRQCEYDHTANLLLPFCDKFGTFLCVSGNHDIRVRDHARQLRRFEKFVESVPGGVTASNGRYWFSHAINGYKFIMMGSDKATFESAFISDEQLAWLDSEIAACGGKPVFVLNHQALAHTNGLPITWLGKGDFRGTVGGQSDAIRAIFEKYKNVYYITGHLHYGTSKYNFEDYGAFKALSVPTVGVINHGDFPADAQGYIVSVYEDKIILRSRVFGEGRYVDPSHPGGYFEVPVD